jgi:hypothetical protein
MGERSGFSLRRTVNASPAHIGRGWEFPYADVVYRPLVANTRRAA